MRRATFFGAVTAVLCCSGPHVDHRAGASTTDPAATRFERLYSCSESGFQRREMLIVRSATELRAILPLLWDQCQPGWSNRRSDSLAIIIVSQGQAGSTGYWIAVDSIVEGPDSTLVYADTHRPGRGCAVGDQLTAPVDVVAAKLSSRPVRLISRELPDDSCSGPPAPNER